jgi:hypothetical protein
MQDKFEVERRARITLEVVCDYPIECLICADKPDLQDTTHSYGIEVVEDCYSNEKEALRFISNVWHKPTSEISSEQIRKLEKLGGSIAEENGVIARAALGTTVDSPEHLISTIKKKVEKLNSGGYKSFSKYGLYVFVNTVSLFDLYVLSVIEVIAEYQIGKAYVYETVYLDGGYEICICNMKQRSFVREPINKEKIREKIWED